MLYHRGDSTNRDVLNISKQLLYSDFFDFKSFYGRWKMGKVLNNGAVACNFFFGEICTSRETKLFL